ncbi:MAG: hypothetical protein IT445_16550 [Phycisphaeraceae bacterium]|nr:hypothetical protein [Phycisphaeraceae bacterium]
MIELLHDRLIFSFPEVHPQAQLSIDFQRTLRIPDDGREYPLPAGLGRFPLRHVEDFAHSVSRPWCRHGGIMLPMYQAEAMWLNFTSNHFQGSVAYPFVVKVAAGKINAVSGTSWEEGLVAEPQNYLEVPRQPWLDGFCVDKGVIRQFVAMPLGAGYSAEEQLAGHANHGGLQIEVFPMRREAFERHFPWRHIDRFCTVHACMTSESAVDMALAPGGRMRQEIYEDPYEFSDWDLQHHSRCFVHLANSMVWRQITGSNPPTTPLTRREYDRAGIPWFEYYGEGSVLKGAGPLANIRSVSEFDETHIADNPSKCDVIPPEPVVPLRAGSTWSKFKQRLNRDWQSHSKNESVRRVIDWARDAFENVRIRNFIFEPFKGVFTFGGPANEASIKTAITCVAIANAVLAGLPGKLGVGVFVSIGMEFWMAWTILRGVGIRAEKPVDAVKYLGVVAGMSVTILMVFRHLLGFAFSTFSAIVPFVNPLVLAELAVTNLVGVLFWVAFEEVRDRGSFRVPLRGIHRLYSRSKALLAHQGRFLSAIFNPENIRLVAKRLKTWFTGEIAVNRPAIRGEMAALAAMAALLEGNDSALEGPMGQMFIDSVKRAYPTVLGGADLDAMRRFFEGHTPEQRIGDLNLIKGEMFEHWVKAYENADGDPWIAELHSDRNIPGSDMVLTKMPTGEQIAVSLKATDNTDLIERALDRYPETPILTTSELEHHFGDNPMVGFVDVSDEQMEYVTKENFDEMLDRVNPIAVAATGAVTKAGVKLWPFVIAYIRGRITRDMMARALKRGLGEDGVALASRVSWAVIFGPVFAWYLLARGVFLLSRGVSDDTGKIRRVVEK